MKAFVSKLPHRKSRRNSGDGDAGDDDGSAPGTPAAAMTPPLMNLSRSASPGLPTPPGPVPSQGKMMMKAGAPPPGVRIVKGPPLPGPSFTTGGQGSVRPGNVSPMRPNGSPPSGAKIMYGPPPPGARIMSGPPPQQIPPGAKIMTGPLPVGAKKMMSVPPLQGVRSGSVTPVKMPPGALHPGAKITSGPPPGAKIITGPPPGVKIITGPPPGAKIMHGVPPPGARIVKMPVSRSMSPESFAGATKSPVLNLISSAAGSRPTSPEHSQAFSKSMPSPPSAAAMKRIMSGSPPPGARLMKMPAGYSPSLSGPPGRVGVPGHSSPGADTSLSLQEKSPATPQLVPQNASFSHPPGSLPSKSQILRPVPVRSRAPPPASVPELSPTTTSTFTPEARGGGGHMSDNFEFDEEPPEHLFPPGAPSESRGREDTSIKFQRAASSASSTMFQEEPDTATALPPVPTRRDKSPSGNSVQSSSIAMRTASSAAKPADDVGAAMEDRGEVDDRVDRKRESKKKHRHHRSKSSRRHRPRRGASSASSSSSELSGKGRSGTAGGRTGSRSGGADGELSRNRRRTHRRRNESGDSAGASDSAEAAGSAGGGGVRGRGGYAPQFSESAMKTATLTPTLRSRIADQFLSILCPQQYYGRVKKINGIRPLNADRAQATGLRRHNCIYVATKGVLPNQLFYPQLRLYEEDGKPTVDDRDRGALDTPIILYEAAPGNMLFAETELEAQRLLDTNHAANSCFVLTSSSILFRDPEQYVLPLAVLNVRWIPYASPQSEPQCPIHHKELQLFDPYTKELVCALCASKDPSHLSKLVVIPDVLKGDSRRKIHESIAGQLHDAQHSAKVWVGQHQRINHLCANKKMAVQQQFDLLAAAVEAKRKEYLEACEAEYAISQSDVAREILLCDERVQLLSAAADHLRTDVAHPLYSMQIATIAEGLEASKQLSGSLSKRPLNVASMSSTVMPNLELVMAELQRLIPDGDAPVPRFDRSPRRTVAAVSHSPYQSRSHGGNEAVAMGGAGAVGNRSPYSSAQRHLHTGIPGGRSASAMAVLPVHRRSSTRVADDLPRSRTVSVQRQRLHSPGSRARSRRGDGNSTRSTPRRPPPPPPVSSRRGRGEDDDGVSDGCGGDGCRGSGSRHHDAANDYRTDAVTVPNSTGTSLFDYPLEELLRSEDEQTVATGSPQKPRKPRMLQWAIRVEDPGDWVGVGVGVGTHIDAWERGRSNDLSHLWIVPGSPPGATGERNVYLVRVTVSPTVGHARLSIHDSRGRQLDDGSIPQWNAVRVCYPQVTFGGRIGQVRMIEAPHIVS